MSKSKILHKRKTPSVEGCIIEVPTINEQIQNIAQKKDTLCRRMYN